ncbi:Y4yA family PLP-dependent enzyme [Demequina sp. NBRC 110051]|uniref:Y4yA family PLP-dependent enzyme n=1 Tax=Demequina sp. NBRC 110051 TaxID=1570340 RepID=UPI00190E7ECF|nr:Y4yA family PLP-dependent enzyme [Demequina sp. NBRC 110051]
MANQAPHVEGASPLTGRTEPWMEDLLADPAQCAALIREHGSPVNVLNLAPLARNSAELTDAASDEGVRLGVYVARKANKTHAVVKQAAAAGLGIDVSSLAELRQCLDLGAAASRLIVTAAVKSGALLSEAVTAGALVSVDNADELADIVAVASHTGVTARVAPRMASADSRIPPTRFGLTPSAWDRALEGLPASVRLEGIHFHLNGYSAAERAVMLREALAWTDHLRESGHPIAFIDMGGGVPMSYLDDRAQWRAFWERLDTDAHGTLTWRGDRLGMTDPCAERPSASVYPYWQRHVRGAWLRDVLRSHTPEGTTVAEEIASRDLELRVEPGRSLLDGCGMTLASVAFRKASSDGIGLVGLHMNRTQVRSTSADFMVDPRWVRPADAGPPSPALEGFLVGAYCVEEELLLRRRLLFPDGVARGDIAAFVNTAGYLMHILESASHQLPLAVNVVRDEGGWVRDGIDGPAGSGTPTG